MIPEALKSLRPEAEWTLNGDTFEGLTWLSEGEPPTESEIMAEIARLQPIAEYRQNRKNAYPALEEQLDMIYHNINQWKTHIQNIKERFPKP